LKGLGRPFETGLQVFLIGFFDRSKTDLQLFWDSAWSGRLVVGCLASD